MKGLIIKDFYYLKNYFSKTMLLFLVFYIIIGLATDMSTLFGGMIMVFVAMLPMSLTSMDESCSWNSYALCAPVSRRDIVLEKFIMSGILMAFGAAVSFVVQLASGVSLSEFALSTCIALAACALFIAIILPVSYKFGAEKARYSIIIVALVPTMLIFISEKLGLDIVLPSEAAIERYMLLSLPAVILILAVSYFITLRIYQKKEL